MKYINLLFLLSPLIILICIKYKSKLTHFIFFNGESKSDAEYRLKGYFSTAVTESMIYTDFVLIAFTAISLYFIKNDYYIFSYSLWHLFIKCISYLLVGVMLYLELSLLADLFGDAFNDDDDDSDNYGKFTNDENHILLQKSRIHQQSCHMIRGKRFY